MKNSFTKREVIMCCISILLLLTLLISIYKTDATTVYDFFLDQWFTIFVSVVSSIAATALLPKVLQGGNPNDGIQLLNLGKSVVPYVYEDTNDPNVDFNKRMNDSISKTRKYFYFSDRALYLPRRLYKDIHNTNDRLEIVVFLADVQDNDIFSSRMNIFHQRERAHNRDKGNASITTDEEIIKIEKLNILRSVYALGQLKSEYNITIYLHKELPFIRYEITDDLLAMSFLTQLSSGKTYPSTLLYENDSVFRINFLDYTKQIISRATLLSDHDLTADELANRGKAAGILDCAPDAITQFYEDLRK